VWRGQQGVQIFFAVSGFLIASTSIARWGSLSKVQPGGFYWIRFARIVPLLFTLLAVLSLLHGIQVKNFVISSEVGGLKAALVAALTLRVGWLEATKGYLPANWDILWSLSVEEMFYLGFPLACRLLGGGRWLIGLLSVFAVLGPFGRTVLTHGNPVWEEYSYLGGMDAIALGCLTAMLVNHQKFDRWILRIFLVAGLAIMIFCLGFGAQVATLGLEKAGLGMTLLAVGTCLVIIAAVQLQWRAPRVLSPFLAYGRRSYEIYLTHMFVVFACFDLFMKYGHPVIWVPVLFAVTIMLAGVLGELVGRFFSEPANRWLRRRIQVGVRPLASVVAGD
jgi:peptidoglycan/LPS O-acetylase OafA/YrhL